MLPRREDALRGSKKGAKFIHDRAIEAYYKNPVICRQCGNIVTLRENERPAQARKKKFCNGSCSATYHNIGRIKVKRSRCLSCSKECGHKKFCNHFCQQQYQYDDFIHRWKAGEIDGRIGICETSRYIRRYFFEKCSNKCQRCGWAEFNSISGKIPLQLNHINGNCLNNTEANLELICPNCHSLTPTFGSLNEQIGRRVLLRKVA